MKLKPRNCLWCGGRFTPQRRDKLSCSRICSVQMAKLNSRRNKASIDVGEKRFCRRCNKWLEKEKNFARANNGYQTICKLCTKIRKTSNAESDLVILHREVETYLYELKAKHYLADVVDIFRLIDLFDKVYPTLQNIPGSKGESINAERSSIEMFERLALWWRYQKIQFENGVGI